MPPPSALHWILGLYAVASIVAFFLFGFDKGRARRHGRRVPERTLLVVALAGGWPGALLGRRIFHHKTRKRAFSALLFAIVLLHLAAWGLVLVLGR